MPEISVRDDQRDAEIMAPWFLHTLNAVSKNGKTKEILKIEIFDKVSLDAFKANPEKVKKYVEMKGSQEYYEIVRLVVNYLEKNGIVTTGANPAKISIT